MAIKWMARDQQPQAQQLSPTSQEVMRGMRELYDACPAEEKSLVRDAFNEYCEGAAEDQGEHNLGPRGSQRPRELQAAEDARIVREIRQIAHDAAYKVRMVAGDYRTPVKVPAFDERYPESTAIKIQW